MVGSRSSADRADSLRPPFAADLPFRERVDRQPARVVTNSRPCHCAMQIDYASRSADVAVRPNEPFAEHALIHNPVPPRKRIS